MAWEWESTHSDFFAAVDGIENPLSMDVHVDPALNGGADVLSIYTGTIMVGKFHGFGGTPFGGTSASAWSRGIVRVEVPTPGRRWTFIPVDGIPEDSVMTHLHAGTVVVSLASIYNAGESHHAGWAVDGADLQALGNEVEGLRIEAKIALRDTDGHLYRLSYQVNALGQAPRGGLRPEVAAL